MAKTSEDRLRLAAGLRGLRLAKSRRFRHPSTPYCLRSLYDATYVVGVLPGGSFALVKASTGRQKIASWFSLDRIEQVLAELDQGIEFANAERAPGALQHSTQTPRGSHHTKSVRRSACETRDVGVQNS